MDGKEIAIPALAAAGSAGSTNSSNSDKPVSESVKSKHFCDEQDWTKNISSFKEAADSNKEADTFTWPDQKDLKSVCIFLSASYDKDKKWIDANIELAGKTGDNEAITVLTTISNLKNKNVQKELTVKHRVAYWENKNNSWIINKGFESSEIKKDADKSLNLKLDKASTEINIDKLPTETSTVTDDEIKKNAIKGVWSLDGKENSEQGVDNPITIKFGETPLSFLSQTWKGTDGKATVDFVYETPKNESSKKWIKFKDGSVTVSEAKELIKINAGSKNKWIWLDCSSKDNKDKKPDFCASNP